MLNGDPWEVRVSSKGRVNTDNDNQSDLRTSR